MFDADFIIIKIIELLELRIPEKKIIEILHKDENYPSLLSVNDTLRKIGIQTEPIEIDIDQLIDQSFPLITHLNYPENKFVIIKGYDIDTKEVSYITNSNKFYIEQIDTFEQKWSGITIRIKNNLNRESTKFKFIKEYFKFNTNILIGILTIVLISLGIITYLTQTKVDYRIIILIPKFFGLIISYFITIKESFADTSWLDNICKAHKIFDCEKVINSRFSKFFNLITLSNAAVVYFLFTTSLFLLGINSYNFNIYCSLLYLLNCMGIPVIALSLYIQIFKTKALCPLCLLIITSFLTETLIYNIWFLNINFKINAILTFEFIFSISVVLIFFYFNTILLKIWKAKFEESKRKQTWFTSCPRIIETILDNQTEIKDTIKEKYKLSLFSYKAKMHLILVINPNCIHCENFVLKIDNIIHKYKEKISIELVFNTNDDKTYLLGEIIRSKNSNEAWYAYIFYIKNGIDEFKKKYKLKENNLDTIKNVIKFHNSWCEFLNIHSTPTILLNKKIVPSILYDDKNFFNYIENLLEN